MATPIPSNQARFSAEELRLALGTPVPELAVCGVSTDSRSVRAGQLFVALRGERFDGHEHAAQAVAKGAVAVVAEAALPTLGVPVLRVPDTLSALGSLALAHRRRWGGRVVAIGGSAGKTTTTRTCAALAELVAPGAVGWQPGNLNNRVGVPSVLLALEPEARLAIVEVGTNQRGEIAELMRICEADAALLTLVELEHTEGLADLDGVEAEEGELLRALPRRALALANADDERAARQLRRSAASRRVSYGHAASADYRIVSRAVLGAQGAELCVRRSAGELWLRTPLLGRAGALATTAALALVEALGAASLPERSLQERLDQAALNEPGRLSPHPLPGGGLLLDDSYNSNPASALASVEAAAELARARGSRLVLVLGEMRELGRLAEPEHRRVGELVAESGAQVLIGVGGHARAFVDAAERAGLAAHFSELAAEAAPSVQQALRPGDVVLVKASRGVKTDQIVQRLLDGTTA